VFSENRARSVKLLLLDESRQGVAEVAADMGYENPAAFSRAFRRHLGISPAVWRARRHDSLSGLFDLPRQRITAWLNAAAIHTENIVALAAGVPRPPVLNSRLSP